MCEIFGASLHDSMELNEYLKTFYGHSDMHPHGWGLACIEDNETSIEKEPIKATISHYLKQRLSVPVTAHLVFAHIRYATIGNVKFQNCHPYTRKDQSGRRWTMIHNGTIFDFPELHKYVKMQMGDTDSERILMYIVDCMDEQERKMQRPILASERFTLLDGIVTELSKGNKLNLLIYDGELLYVHTNYANSLHFLNKKEGILFSTQPLSREAWQPVPFTTLLAYQNGKRLYKGTNHGNEYIDSEENMKYLYQIFSDL